MNRQHKQPRATSTGFGFEEIMRDPDYTRFETWYARYSFFAAGPVVSDVFSRPYAVEAGIDLDEAA
jgi:hypothetical protein